MSQVRVFEPPLSARRAAIFRQADDARRVSQHLHLEYLRIRADLEVDPYRELRPRRSQGDGGRRAKAED